MGRALSFVHLLHTCVLVVEWITLASTRIRVINATVPFYAVNNTGTSEWQVFFF